MIKHCNGCKTDKDISEFAKRSDRPSGVQSRCKACHSDRMKGYKWAGQREKDLKRYYGITLADYEALLQKQNGACAICHTTEQKGGRFKNFCVDHDHATGKVRGLLCYDCNFGLGKFQDNIGTLEAAVKYLADH